MSSVPEILLSLTSVKDVRVSINSEWWDWGQQNPPQPRYMGKIVKWMSKTTGKEQLSIECELGLSDQGVQLEGFSDAEKADLTKASARNGKVLTDPRFAQFPTGSLFTRAPPSYPAAEGS